MTTFRAALALILLSLIALPAAAGHRGPYDGDNWLRVRIGQFTPRGENDYWIDKRNDFTGDENSFEDTLVGLDFVRALGPRMSLILSANSWEADTAQQYRDFTDQAGGPIFHTTSFDVTSLDFGLLFHLSRRNASLIPYLGAGGAYYDWTLVEEGEFIDFTDLTIFSDRFEQNGDTFGWFWVAGLEVPLGEQFRLFAESRWDRVDDDLTGDFAGLGVLDLSGRTISFGGGWSF